MRGDIYLGDLVFFANFSPEWEFHSAEGTVWTRAFHLDKYGIRDTADI